MPDLSLTTLTPLGAESPRTDRIGAIEIAEDVSRALASLACRLGREADFDAAADAALGVAMPAPGRFGANDRYRVIWTGPGQFFVETDLDAESDLEGSLKAAFGASASITDQTDAWARFVVTGESVAAMFERLCAVDLGVSEAGDSTRTIMEHVGVFLLCLEPGRRYAVLGPRSSAGSLHHVLSTAAKTVV